MIDEFQSVKALPTRLNLKELYPHTFRSIFAKSFWPLLALLVVTIGYYYAVSDIDNLGNSEVPIESLSAQTLYYILRVVSVICIGKLIYEFLFWLTYSYYLEVEHLTIVRGLIYRTRASFPIAKINDVSLKRNLIELIFGIYVVDILTASPEVNFGEIYGLSKKNAVNLQTHLLALVETTLPDVKENVVEAAMERDLTAEQLDKLIHHPRAT